MKFGLAVTLSDESFFHIMKYFENLDDATDFSEALLACSIYSPSENKWVNFRKTPIKEIIVYNRKAMMEQIILFDAKQRA